MKKFLAALLASAMLFTVVSAAQPTTSSKLAEYSKLPFAEFIRAVVVAYDGKEQPQIMDSHYAMPYIIRAEKLGIIPAHEGTSTDYLNEIASQETMSNVLQKTAKLENADMEKIIAAINALAVEKIIVNGKTVVCPIAYRNGSIMLPVRAISEALGYTVSWDQKSYTATVNTGKIKSDVSIGTNSYFYTSVAAIGMSKPSPMASAPLLQNDTTYVPFEFFNLVSTATIENGVVTIK